MQVILLGSLFISLGATNVKLLSQNIPISVSYKFYGDRCASSKHLRQLVKITALQVSIHASMKLADNG